MDHRYDGIKLQVFWTTIILAECTDPAARSRFNNVYISFRNFNWHLHIRSKKLNGPLEVAFLVVLTTRQRVWFRFYYLSATETKVWSTLTPSDLKGSVRLLTLILPQYVCACMRLCSKVNIPFLSSSFHGVSLFFSNNNHCPLFDSVSVNLSAARNMVFFKGCRNQACSLCYY